MKEEHPKDIQTAQKELSIHPHDIVSLSKLADYFYDKQEYSQSLTFNARILQINPQAYWIHYSVGNIFLNLQQFEKAIIYYQHAININKNYTSAYINLGLCLTNIGDNLSAIEILLQALDQEPTNIYTLNNLGNALQNTQRFQDSILVYKEAIKISSTFKEPYNGLATTYMYLGLFDTSIQVYEEVIKKNTNFTSSITNLLMILVQLQKTKAIQQVPLLASNKMHDVFLLLHSFLSQDFLTSKILLKKLKEEKLPCPTQKDTKFTEGYIPFIENLLTFQKESLSKDTSFSLYHIGESHTLSFAHQTTFIDKKLFSIKPLIIFGAKAFHLDEEKENYFKHYFNYHIKNLKEDSYLLVSFGEIDTREDEGILPFHLKTGEDIQTIVTRTVTNYIKYTSTLLKKKNIHFSYTSVPAPVLNNTSQLLDAKRILIIATFNASIKNICKQMKLNYTDTYSLTKNKEKSSNKKYMIDRYHLSPKILEVLEFNFNHL